RGALGYARPSPSVRRALLPFPAGRPPIRAGTPRTGTLTTQAEVPMHALVATVVHHPEDARILHRQIRALLDAGHSVTYLAPFRERGVTPWPELTAVDVPRAAGRRRLR